MAVYVHQCGILTRVGAKMPMRDCKIPLKLGSREQKMIDNGKEVHVNVYQQCHDSQMKEILIFFLNKGFDDIAPINTE